MIINIKVNNMTGGSRMAVDQQSDEWKFQQMANNNARIIALDKQINNLQQELRRLNTVVKTSAMEMHNIGELKLSGADLQTAIGKLQGEWRSNTLKASQVKTQLKTLEKQINTLREQNRILLGQLAGTRSPSSRLSRNPSPTYTDLSRSQIANTATDIKRGTFTMMRSESDRTY